MRSPICWFFGGMGSKWGSSGKSIAYLLSCYLEFLDCLVWFEFLLLSVYALWIVMLNSSYLYHGQCFICYCFSYPLWYAFFCSVIVLIRCNFFVWLLTLLCFVFMLFFVGMTSICWCWSVCFDGCWLTCLYYVSVNVDLLVLYLGSCYLFISIKYRLNNHQLTSTILGKIR